MHPSVVLASAAVASATWTVVAARRCRSRVAAKAPASETWHAGADVLLSVLLFAIMAIALLAPLLAAQSYVTGTILLGGAAGYGLARLCAYRARRLERRAEELAMLERGLPVREPALAWKVVGMLAFVGGLFAVALHLTWITVVLMLMRGTAYTPGDTVMTIATAIWIGGASMLTLRQWLRIRRIDRRYWPSFRAALERTEPRP